MSISDLSEKIKHLPEESWHNFFVILIIIGVAFSSFAIGRFSIEKGNEVEILYPEEILERAADSSSNAKIIASSRGSKYYYSWCPGVENLSESNRIEFSSKEEAERLGYTLAQNCDGPN